VRVLGIIGKPISLSLKLHHLREQVLGALYCQEHRNDGGSTAVVNVDDPWLSSHRRFGFFHNYCIVAMERACVEKARIAGIEIN
jgi:hypothetical protein